MQQSYGLPVYHYIPRKILENMTGNWFCLDFSIPTQFGAGIRGHRTFQLLNISISLYNSRKKGSSPLTHTHTNTHSHTVPSLVPLSPFLSTFVSRFPSHRVFLLHPPRRQHNNAPVQFNPPRPLEPTGGYTHARAIRAVDDSGQPQRHGKITISLRTE